MATGWETLPVEFSGGLVTNLGPLQLGINQPGSARRLVNFEPSITGGYKRVLGYTKFNNTFVPRNGGGLVQGSGQTGTTLLVANLPTQATDGETFTIQGVTGTYTVVSSTYDSALKTSTLTISPTLASSPADKAEITFANVDSRMNMMAYFRQRAVVARDNVIWEGQTSGAWTKISVPSVGSPLVNGGSQTGTTLTVDAFTSNPSVGDTFTIDGVELVYTVTAVSLTAGAGTLTISPALASSPADNAAITFIGSSRISSNKHRFVRYTFGTSPTLMIVDGQNVPVRYSVEGFRPIPNAPADIIGAEHVAEFKSHIFLAKGTLLAFSAPLDDEDFTPGNGAGVVNLAHAITGLIVFRDQLIVFCRSKIYRIVGTSFADFQLIPISLDIGCIEPDSIQEVGGDVAFLAPDGLRLLGGTERIGDFNFGIISREIQSEILSLLRTNSSFTSVVIRNKNQYRLFGYTQTRTPNLSDGILGTQFADQSDPMVNFSWAELKGLKVYVADSQYSSLDSSETSIFANEDGIVYQMETGNNYDGATIEASFYTPYWIINDPRVRKTLYKATTYIAPEGTVRGSLNVKYDFGEPGVIQPPAVSLGNTVTGTPVWGQVVWGAFEYSNQIETNFNSQVTGSGFTVSLEYTFTEETPPFSLDSVMLEFSTNDRK